MELLTNKSITKPKIARTYRGLLTNKSITKQKMVNQNIYSKTKYFRPFKTVDMVGRIREIITAD